MAEEGDLQDTGKRFYIDLASKPPPADDLSFPSSAVARRVWDCEIEGQTIAVCKWYLSTCNCPDTLVQHITGEVLAKTREHLPLDFQKGDNPPNLDKGRAGISFNYVEGHTLAGHIVGVIHQVCTDWSKQTPHFSEPEDPVTLSVQSIRNGRRKMEDRHVVCTDVNALFHLKDAPEQSYYAVFDGHSGVDAADFSAANLICNIVRHKQFPTDIESAMKDGFIQTDTDFCTKAVVEHWKSGTTCVCAFIRDQQLTIGWAGDSQAALVRKGKAVPIMFPHKPDRPDEKERIEAAGSSVLWIGGSWRVDGMLAVARSIGDLEYKPAVTGEPDIITLELDGTEDFLVLACDGVWDVLDEDTLAVVLRTHIKSGGERQHLGKIVADYCKSQGSSDNITVIVVCFPRKSPSRQSSGASASSPPSTPERKPAAVVRQKQLDGEPSSAHVD